MHIYLEVFGHRVSHSGRWLQHLLSSRFIRFWPLFWIKRILDRKFRAASIGTTYTVMWTQKRSKFMQYVASVCIRSASQFPKSLPGHQSIAKVDLPFLNTFLFPLLM